MVVTLILSPSLTSSEQSAIRQTVAYWSVAIGGTNPQGVFPGRKGKGGGGGAGSHPHHFHLSHSVSMLENRACKSTHSH